MLLQPNDPERVSSVDEFLKEWDEKMWPQGTCKVYQEDLAAHCQRLRNAIDSETRTPSRQRDGLQHARKPTTESSLEHPSMAQSAQDPSSRHPTHSVEVGDLQARSSGIPSSSQQRRQPQHPSPVRSSLEFHCNRVFDGGGPTPSECRNTTAPPTSNSWSQERNGRRLRIRLHRPQDKAADPRWTHWATEQSRDEFFNKVGKLFSGEVDFVRFCLKEGPDGEGDVIRVDSIGLEDDEWSVVRNDLDHPPVGYLQVSAEVNLHGDGDT